MSALVICLGCGVAAADRLPRLEDDPWTGWFAGYESRDFHFGVNRDGEGQLMPLDGSDDEPVSPRYWIEFQPVIEEVLPSGRVRTKRVQETGWEALTEPGEDVEKMSYRGTVTDGARFEVHFELDGSEVRGGGRVLEKGGLTEHPIRFALRVKIPNLYVYEDSDDVLEDLAGDDRILLQRADGKELDYDGMKVVWAEKEASGPGVRTAEIELHGYDGEDVELESGPAGLFEFWNGSKRELYKGFTLGWKPDPEEDPEGEARFVLDFG